MRGAVQTRSRRTGMTSETANGTGASSAETAGNNLAPAHRPAGCARGVARFLETRLELFWRANCSHRVFSRGVRCPPAMARRASLCGPRGSVPVSAGLSFQPSRLFNRALASWLPGRSLRLDWFYVASAIVLVLFVYGAGALSGTLGTGLLHGLKLVAVQSRASGHGANLVPNLERAFIALLTALIILFSTSPLAQIGAIVLGGAAKLWLCRRAEPTAGGHVVCRFRARRAWRCPRSGCLAACRSSDACVHIRPSAVRCFYRSGALVFGGGHVVLPLLRQAFVAPGWVSDNTFLAGYGAAQASGAAFHIRSLPGRRGQSVPTWDSRCGIGLGWHFSASYLDLLGAAVLGHVSQKS